MKKLTKNILLISSAFALTGSFSVVGGAKVHAATIPDWIFLDKTGTPIGESDVSSIPTKATFNSGKHDAGMSWDDVAIVLHEDISNYIVYDVYYEHSAGKTMTEVTLPYPVEGSNSYSGLYGCAIEGIGQKSGSSYTPAFSMKSGESTSLSTVKIPSTVGSIYDSAFKNCSTLTTVTFTKSSSEEIRLNTYGKNVFTGCTSLTSFTIPCPISGEITFSGSSEKNGAFYGSGLTSVVFADGLTKIPANALLGADKLTKVSYGDRITEIGAKAFSCCTSLTSFDVKANVTTIGNGAFEKSTSLKNVTLRQGLKEIGSSVFASTSIEEISIPASVSTIGSGAFKTDSLKKAVFAQDAVNSRVSIPDNALSDATGLTEVIIPDVVTEIGKSAFKNTSALKSLNGIEHIVSIGDSAFVGSGLTGEVKVTSIESIGGKAFSGCSGITKLILGNGLKSVGTNIIEGTSITELALPASLSDCSGTPFKGASKLEKLSYPGTEIPANIFAEAMTVKTIVLSDDVNKVYDKAFYKCYSYENNLSFAKVTSFGANAFYGCYSFKNPVDISAATEFGASAFAMMVSDDSKDINAYVADPQFITFVGSFNPATTVIGQKAFMGAYNMNFPVVITGSGSVEIGAQAFEGTTVTKVDIANVKSIGKQAFSYDPSSETDLNKGFTFACPLTSIKLTGGEKVSVGDYAFFDCEKVTSFSIAGAGITSIGSFAFYGINEIKELKLPATVTSLNGGCFGGWSISSITLPSSLKACGISLNKNTTLYHGPFTICKNLKEIIFEEGITSIPSNLFYHAMNAEDSAITLEIPESVVEIQGDSGKTDKAAFGGNVVKSVSVKFGNAENAQKLAAELQKQFNDGDGNVNVNYQVVNKQDVNIRKFLTRMYQVCLNRTPDEGGLQFWVNEIKTKSGAEVAAGFVFSDEFKAKNLCNNDYVEQLYLAFMGRQYDEGGKAYWLGLMASGSTREDVFNGFVMSNEFNAICESYQIKRGEEVKFSGNPTVPSGPCSICGAQTLDNIAAFVTRLYQVCLDRSPDQVGLEFWCQPLRAQTTTGKAVAHGFVFSDEFVAHNYDNNQYLEHLYQAFLGRSSDAVGMNFWLGQFASGASREDVFNGFVASDEFAGICASYGIVRE